MSDEVRNTAASVRRGRPPRISRSAIVDAAIDIGLKGLSMDAVARQLDVTTPALYTHVRGRAELVQLTAAAVISRSMAQLQAASDWESWLRDWARLLREQLGAVGGDLVAALEGGVDIASLDAAERGIELLTDAGLTPLEAAHTLWLTARLAFSADATPRSSVAQAATEAMDSKNSTSGGPMSVALAALQNTDVDAVFEFEVDIIVRGLRQRMSAGGDSRTRS